MSKQKSEKQVLRPQQHQDHQPGIESEMKPPPVAQFPEAVLKLKNKIAVITGGDSGIGKAVALAFAEEGADIAIVYLNEHEDAKSTAGLITQKGRRCLLFSGDVGDPKFCQGVVEKILSTFGKIDILVNNAAEQHEHDNILEISPDELERTFRTNIFSYFFMSQAVLKQMKAGGVILNTTSVTAYRGSPKLLDYSATKGAIVSFTRSLARALIEKQIRVNAVAPGPVWTPLIPASFDEKKVATFGSDSPMHRAAQPAEIAPSYVFLASNDASFISGQVLHPNGGEVVNG